MSATTGSFNEAEAFSPRKLAPGNLEFDGSAKIYRRAEEFTPLFEHDPFRSLVAIAERLGDAEVETCPHTSGPSTRCA
ncbi:hypothetical protein [Cereibacter johrii]|uniref:Uncharacterized protein n=1 Tax=Cereibacter johrii TaxID=445629 RepID=A0ABX5J383_9RHOB|nr:hypothetical protein [Cereibacter johrii]PTM75289.1 hypothetical protein C8J29_11279 [Cereibacter johrii]